MVIENTPAAWSTRAGCVEPWTAALWSEQGQRDRFNAVLSHLELKRGDSLLDYGCGPGLLAEHVPADMYVGCDWAAGMRDRARQEHQVPVLAPSELEPLLFDHVVCVGTFNLADGWSREQTFEKLAELWALHARRSLVVSLYRGGDPSCIHYDPTTLVVWAQALAADRWSINCWRHNDVILALYRDEVPA